MSVKRSRNSYDQKEECLTIPTMMRLWTIQTVPAWQQCQNLGILRANPDYIQSYFLPAYRWLTEQMQERIGLPPAGVAYPIWAWYQYDGIARRRPDLRHSSYLPRGTQGVLLTCEIPDDVVLLSDFQLWHCVLNNWYLPLDEADETAFEQRYGRTRQPDKVHQQAIEASWNRIFDLDWAAEDYAVPRHKKAIQAVFWELRCEYILKVAPFTAR